MKRVYLITGVTGDLGGELLWRLAEDADNEIYCLVRDKNNKGYQERIIDVIAANEIRNKQNIIAVKGDVSESNLGFDENEIEALSKKVTNIIHCAADVRFNQPIDQIRTVNVNGTKNMLEFAKKCYENNSDFNNFVYVGTAYVVGRKKGIVLADDLSDQYGFNNSYEQSKYEAESLVRSHMESGLPVMIFRPSVILGAAESGEFKKTSVLYPLIVMQNKLMPKTILPVTKKVKLDIVPIDFVAKALLYISSDQENINKSFHLASGCDGAVCEADFGKIMAEELQIKNVLFVPSILWAIVVYPIAKFIYKPLYKRLMKLKAMNSIGGYESYFREINPEFSIEATKKALEGSDIRIPRSDNVLRACVRFGKKTYVK